MNRRGVFKGLAAIVAATLSGCMTRTARAAPMLKPVPFADAKEVFDAVRGCNGHVDVVRNLLVWKEEGRLQYVQVRNYKNVVVYFEVIPTSENRWFPANTDGSKLRSGTLIYQENACEKRPTQV